jgi:hypothetical protein
MARGEAVPRHARNIPMPAMRADPRAAAMVLSQCAVVYIASPDAA